MKINFRSLFGLMILLWLFIGSGCKRDTAFSPDYYYNYFPVNEGHWILYQVDSIAYDELSSDVDTFHYYVLETIGESFLDGEGRESQRVRRQMKKSDTTSWFTTDIWYQLRTKTTAERVEENRRFIKLVFPARPFVQWYGNSYITYDDVWNCNYLGDWQYEYSYIDEPHTVGSNTFDSALFVTQVADSGLVCKNYGVEVYALGVGMVYKRLERLTTQNTSALPFYLRAEKGFILTYRILDWRK